MDMQGTPRQPHSIEVEQALLGCILINNDAFARVASFLKPEHFYDELHGSIFDLCAKRIGSGHIADPKTLKAFLAEREVGDITLAEYVARLAEEATTIGNAEDYGRTIHELAIRRDLVAVAMDAETIARDAPPDAKVGEILEELEGRFAAIRSGAKVAGYEMDIRNAVQDALNAAGNAFKAGASTGWPWCLDEIGTVLDGPLEPGNLYGLLGKSGDGKTSLIMQQIRFSAERGVPCLFLSGEQSREQCAWQLSSQKIGIEAARMKAGQLTEEEFERYFEDAREAAKLPISIQKWAGLRVSGLAMRVRSFVKAKGPGIVVIDHAKKIAPENPRDILAQQVFQVFSDLKDVMADNGCAGIVLMQQNADSTKRNIGRPVRSDAYGGEGGLQNLDACLALFRPDKFLEERITLEDREKEIERLRGKLDHCRGVADFYSLKTRFGEEGRKARVRFRARFTRFETMRDQNEGLFGA